MDTPFRFVTGALYDLPLGRGEHHSTGNHWADEIIGRWQLNLLPAFAEVFRLHSPKQQSQQRGCYLRKRTVYIRHLSPAFLRRALLYCCGRTVLRVTQCF